MISLASSPLGTWICMPGTELAKLMSAAGFAEVSYRTFAGGIVALHTGRLQ